MMKLRLLTIIVISCLISLPGRSQIFPSNAPRSLTFGITLINHNADAQPTARVIKPETGKEIVINFNPIGKWNVKYEIDTRTPINLIEISIKNSTNKPDRLFLKIPALVPIAPPALRLSRVQHFPEVFNEGVIRKEIWGKINPTSRTSFEDLHNGLQLTHKAFRTLEPLPIKELSPTAMARLSLIYIRLVNELRARHAIELGNEFSSSNSSALRWITQDIQLSSRATNNNAEDLKATINRFRLPMKDLIEKLHEQVKNEQCTYRKASQLESLTLMAIDEFDADSYIAIRHPHIIAGELAECAVETLVCNKGVQDAEVIEKLGELEQFMQSLKEQLAPPTTGRSIDTYLKEVSDKRSGLEQLGLRNCIRNANAI